MNGQFQALAVLPLYPLERRLGDPFSVPSCDAEEEKSLPKFPGHPLFQVWQLQISYL
jgi:hypothetical protein